MQFSMDLRPLEISANRGLKQLTIRWNDNHLSVYPFQLLRAACPCAACRGGHEYMRAEPDEAAFTAELGDTPATRLRAIKAVGSYAITIEWEDGHSYGIFTWQFLRALCPCPICRPTAS